MWKIGSGFRALGWGQVLAKEFGGGSRGSGAFVLKVFVRGHRRIFASAEGCFTKVTEQCFVQHLGHGFDV